MKNYQLIFFLSPNLEEKEANRYLEKIRSDIKNLEGEIKETKKNRKKSACLSDQKIRRGFNGYY